MDGSKIKRFGEFVANYNKLFNQLIIVGKTKGLLFFKGKDFELKVYYTPMKRKIVDIKCEGVDIDSLLLTFKVGDDISKAKDWASQNGHSIKTDIKRI